MDTPHLQAPSVSAGRRMLLLIALLFAAPVLLGWAVYATRGWWNLETVNYGELIRPARPLQDQALRRLGGGALRLDHLRGKWTLVYLGPSSCPTNCRDSLYKMRQVRLALGEDSLRVQRLFVLTDRGDPGALPPLLAQHPGLTVATAEGPALHELVGEFSPRGLDDAVYLVDPLGNLMMRYPQGFQPRGMLRDLQRLLQVSSIG